MYINNILYRQDIERILVPAFEKLRGKTFFITGTSGLVGSFLADVLLYLNEKHNYGMDIWGTFSSQKSFDERFPSYVGRDDFHAVIQDINQPITLDLKPDYIIHAASNTHPALYANNPVETIKLNVNGTSHILDFAKEKQNCRVLFLSTLEVYGEDKTVDKFNEQNIGKVDFTYFRSCYPESKRLCETLCSAYNKEYGTDIVTARLGYIYGPTVKLNSSKADVQFLNKALAGEDIVLKSRGLQQRSYCYVADTVAALLFILLKANTGESYNVASTQGNIRLHEFAEILAEFSGVKVVFDIDENIAATGGSQVQNSTLDSFKLESLGWKSCFSPNDGIEHTLQIKKEILGDNNG
ncbi:MAG: NAD-dependent epimerase/dehydratase family protein [Alphaproteobacteria bacterium]|nr:NAD-dependent epimerase/dehydratase family protein [Alphaproteobacteria bacterium]